MLNDSPVFALEDVAPFITLRPKVPLLDLHLSATYTKKRDVLSDVELTIQEGEVVGLIGESGSGKSTLALSILRLLETKGGDSRGEMTFRGRRLDRLKQSHMRRIRGREIALISQSALAALNPALKIGSQFAECWKAHRRKSGARADWKRPVFEILERVCLPANETFLRHYPRELSVGQAQRVLIAMAVLHRPKLLIADEPTSALDAITRSEVVDLLRRLNRETGLAILFISHDLLLVASLCSQIAILRNGKIVESGPAAEVFWNPSHPYTRTLLGVLPNGRA